MPKPSGVLGAWDPELLQRLHMLLDMRLARSNGLCILLVEAREGNVHCSWVNQTFSKRLAAVNSAADSFD